MNLSHTLLDALKQHGTRAMFGIRGDFVLAFFQQAVEAAILPLYTLSHEPAVGFAADAAARFHAERGEQTVADIGGERHFRAAAA
jgi:indolepyruvate decarboxylase